jgi:hypothetical protein
VADQLSLELGYVDGEELPGGEARLGGEVGGRWRLDSRDEHLIGGLRQRLAKLAAALGTSNAEATSRRDVGFALDGAELVMRGEIVKGNAAKLPALMPDFVFLVALPVIGQDKALLLSVRARELVEGALGS